jgi:hypothetical protein
MYEDVIWKILGVDVHKGLFIQRQFVDYRKCRAFSWMRNDHGAGKEK